MKAMGKNRRPGPLPALALAAAAGLLAGLALPPLGLPPLLWLALALLWAQAGSPHPWRGGALWGAAAVLVSHSALRSQVRSRTMMSRRYRET
jgi:apolipoprotein N-acyltransferase